MNDDKDIKQIVCYSLNIKLLKKLYDFKNAFYKNETDISIIVECAISNYINDITRDDTHNKKTKI